MSDTIQDNFEKDLKNQIETNKINTNITEQKSKKVNKMVVVEYGQSYENTISSSSNNKPIESLKEKEERELKEKEERELREELFNMYLKSRKNLFTMAVREHGQPYKRNNSLTKESDGLNCLENSNKNKIECKQKEFESQLEEQKKTVDKETERKWENYKKRTNNNNLSNEPKLFMAMREHGQPYNNSSGCNIN